MQKHFPADNLQQRGGNAQPAPIFVRLVKHFVEVSSGFVRKGWKGSVYEGGLRVPMIVRYPGKVKAGARSDTPGYFADWFPTLCEATGLETPDGLDGESLWPVITGGESKADRKPMVWVYPEYGGQVAVMMGKMKALRRGLTTTLLQGFTVSPLRTPAARGPRG